MMAVHLKDMTKKGQNSAGNGKGDRKANHKAKKPVKHCTNCKLKGHSSDNCFTKGG